MSLETRTAPLSESRLTESTLYEMFANASKIYASQIALTHCEGGQWHHISYDELFNQVTAMAGYLQHIGVGQGDRVGIFMTNCPQWVIMDLACFQIGAIVVPIYPTLSPKEIYFIIENAGLTCIALNCQTRFETLLNYRLPSQSVPTPSTAELSHLILHLPDQQLESLPKTIRINQRPVDTHSFSEALRSNKVPAPVNLKGADLASIVYTSGTTGAQKGVMLTHSNFLTNISDILSVYSISTSDKALSFLPLSHVFERTAGYYTLIAKGATICYAQSQLTVAKDLQFIKPTVLISVPRLYEKIYAKIMMQTTGLKRKLLNWALDVGRGRGIKSWVADQLVFRKIREKTGGKLRFCVSGGAPLPPHLCDFFYTIGLLVLEGYGLTETSPVIACNTEHDFQFGTVGHPLPSLSLHVAEDGELIVHGPSVMSGYWQNESETCAAMTSDGGFKTGDLVKIDPQGYLKIVGRKKHLIVLSNGKNIAPNYVESMILKSKRIDQVMVVGDQKHFLTALIVPNYEIPEIKLAHPTELKHLIQSEIDRFQSALSNYEKVKKFAILDVPFQQENGMLTPTLKLKRNFIIAHYENTIKLMYNEIE